jgi:hypothetical protein
VRRILAPSLFVLNLPVALARAPGKIAFESGGRVKDFVCVDVGQCNNGRLGVSLLEEAQMTNNGASNAKATLAVKCYRIQEGSSPRCYPHRNP